MLLQEGSRGENVRLLQEFLDITADGDFGPGTKKAVMEWQTEHGLSADGIAGSGTLAAMGLTLKEDENRFDETYKDVTIQGAVFPGSPAVDTLRIRLSQEMENEYLPALEKAMGNQPKGFKLLCTIMAQKEGFRKNTRSYRTNNPGNIGNTDSGRNKSNSTLSDGILLQKDYILKIVNGENSSYPMGQRKVIPPYYSPEIARNAATYGISPYVPGYEFVFTGQLNQFVKIYSTGARVTNSYLSAIMSYFRQNGLRITQESTLQEIIRMEG